MGSGITSPIEVHPGVWVSGAEGLDAAVAALGVSHVLVRLWLFPARQCITQCQCMCTHRSPHPRLPARRAQSVVNLGAPPPPPAAARHLHIDLEDVPEANLLQHLPAALDFVAAGAAGAGALVHCAQGVSRSAAVAAAHLMRAAGLGPDEALAALRARHPAAEPNSGFVGQLRMFHDMGCALDPGHAPYKRFLLEQAGRRHDETGEVDADSFSHPQEDAATKVNPPLALRAISAAAAYLESRQRQYAVFRRAVERASTRRRL